MAHIWQIVKYFAMLSVVSGMTTPRPQLEETKHAVNGFTKVSKWFKTQDPPLRDQMKRPILDGKLILPDDTFELKAENSCA